ncbi:MAG TPA: hypothetical protein VGI74_24565 [Streptosporangiaceae bacterium]|jgi:hypothetical protein
MSGYPPAFQVRRGRRAAMTGLAMLTAASMAVLAGGGNQTSAFATVRSFPGGGTGATRTLSTPAARHPAQTRSGDGPQSGISDGVLFGGTQQLVPEESALGRKLRIIRLYYYIGNSFPGKPAFQQLMAGGRTVLASLDSPGDSYASIAAGDHDTAIMSFLESMNKNAIKYHLGSIYVSFEHEPDNHHHHQLGSPPEFIQAWDHVHQLAQAAHLDWNDGGRLHWVFILVHNTYSSWRAATFWPGASEADIVATDGYNSFGCGNGGQTQPQTPDQSYSPVVNFAASHGGLPIFIAEWGSVDIPSGTRANFVSEMGPYVASEPSIAAVSYWDINDGACDYQVQGDSAALSNLTTMGQTALMQGHISGSGGTG